MTSPGSSTNGNGNTDGNGKQRAVPTAVDAITKISKILDQLSPTDRKRVLAFVNESNA
jgi:hypothetical protein